MRKIEPRVRGCLFVAAALAAAACSDKDPKKSSDDPPSALVTARADAYTTGQDQPLVVAAPGVLANDSSARGLALYAEPGDTPAHGALQRQSDGSFTYTPELGFVGSDVFTYRATDLDAFSEVTVVSITVTPGAGAPSALADAYTLVEDSTLSLVAAQGVLSNDTDPQGTALTATVMVAPSHGSLTLATSGALTYTPASNYFGEDTFTYAASDGSLGAQAVVTLTITALPDAPVALADALTLNEDATLVLAAAAGPLANDSDADGDVLSLVVDQGPASGALAANPDGSLTFTPPADFNGALTFSYHASDGVLSSASALVTLTVSPVNDAPTLGSTSLSTIEDEPRSGFLVGQDVDGDALTYAVASAPTHGTVAVASNTGGFTYTPAAGYRGADSFSVVASDGLLSSAPAVVSVTVAAPPAPEITSLLPYVAAAGTPLQIFGSYLGTDATVTVGGTAMTALSRSKTYVVVRLAGSLPAGDHELILTRGDGAASSPELLRIVPWLDAITPDRGGSSGTLTVSGRSFGTSGSASVGGLAASSTSWSATTVQLQLPGGLASRDNRVELVTGGVASNTLSYFLIAPNSWLPAVGLTQRKQHTAVWTGNEMVLWGGHDGVGPLDSGARYDPVLDAYRPTSNLGTPSPRVGHTAVWTGEEMLVWGGAAGGARYNPMTDTWTAITGGPSTRSDHCAVWTGSRMLVFGGRTSSVTSSGVNTGGSYDPTTDTWQTLSTTNAPSARSKPLCVWTGTRMIAWSGISTSHTSLNTGGIYNPGTNTWTTMAPAAGGVGTNYLEHAAWTGKVMMVKQGMYDPALDAWTNYTSAPRTRTGARRVWTGSRLVVWGGCWDQGVGGCSLDDRGEWFEPATGTWGLINSGLSSTGMDHTAVWTGAEMIAVGGSVNASGNATSQGIRYEPSSGAYVNTAAASQAWRAYNRATVDWVGALAVGYGGLDQGIIPDPSGRVVTASIANPRWSYVTQTGQPANRYLHTATWTGARLVVFGGLGTSGASLDSGGRFDPTSNTWSATSTTAPPSARRDHGAVWTGSRVLVWGGLNGTTALGDGASYDPVGDTWTPLSTTNAPAGRSRHVTAWTGTELLVWGGKSGTSYLADGGRYNPQSDTWTPIAAAAEITGRADPAWAWTGTELLVWGGEVSSSAVTNTGARYTPGSGWTALPTTNAPTARKHPAFTWTGSQLFIWAGSGNAGGGMNAPTGALFDPSSSTWTAVSLDRAPSTTTVDRATWTGTYVLLSTSTASEARLFAP